MAPRGADSPTPQALGGLALAATFSLLLLACSATPPRTSPSQPPPAPVVDFVPQPRFEGVGWEELPGWNRDDAAEAFAAFRAGCAVLRSRAPWQAACAQAFAEPPALPTAAARAFFERHFQPWRVTTTDASGARVETGQITGYFEPVLRGSRKRDARYTVPLYGVPDDLVTIDLGELYPSLQGERVRGRLVGKRVVPYPDRAGIVRGEGPRGKELVWVDSAVDAFFLQIQGSGRVRLPDGQTIRIAYADQNGHPYRAIGRVLVERQELTVEQATAPGLRAWLAANPARADEILSANPSFVFFREEALTDPSRGPRGALNVPLTAGRSIAVDPRNLPLGAPVFLATQHPDGQALERLVMAQDTGGAIRGIVRADYFFGLGPVAGDQAGRMRAQGRMWLLWPREAGPPMKP
jgi:membrane-bound lytic murein transglycosylase A